MKLAHTIYNRCFSVAICVLLMVGSLQGAVLCKGVDTHVAVETISGDCCDNLPVSAFRKASPGSVEQVFPSSSDNCIPCVDVPISTKFVGFFKKSNQINSMSLTSTTTVPITVSSSDFSEYEYRLASGLIAKGNPSLTSLCSIILLI